MFGNTVRCQLLPTLNGTNVLALREDLMFNVTYTNGKSEEEITIVYLESIDSIDDEFYFEIIVPPSAVSIVIEETKTSKSSNATSKPPPLFVIKVGMSL